jgi:4-alpha-glucanotransferase
VTDALEWGVQQEFHDAAGRRVRAGDDTVAAVISSLRERAGGDHPEPPGALILHPGDRVAGPLDVVTEDGRSLRIDGAVGDDVPLGYHQVERLPGPRRLIVSPRRCHLPADLRVGGWAAQVYAARSRRSWGAGDLADLATLGRWAAEAGAGFTLINPLNAVAPVTPAEASPYLPTSRRWRNPLYLRVEDVPGSALLGAELDSLAAAGRALNNDRHIDRDAVLALKLDALGRIHAVSPRRRAFSAWRRQQGDDLERFATFCVIAEQHGGDFRSWPPELRSPSAPAVARVRRSSRQRVEFHAWLQWQLDEQLAGAASALPVMVDLPIGVDPGGADVWADPGVFAGGFTVGAPPDLFNPLGQNWAQAPWDPWRLRAGGYEHLAAVLRAGFRHAMGLRIDHVMGLFRLWWVPPGADPAHGVYVRYPATEMLDVLALESVRAGAVVVGEDLGTVEEGVREQMADHDILSYRLLWFEDEPPSRFPRHAMSAVTTHDLPTVAGLWTGADLAAQRAIGMPVNEQGTAEIRRRLERVVGRSEAPVEEVITTVYAALAASPSMIVAAALEDAAAVIERPNMPGTTAERWPNWRLALPQPLEDVLGSPLATAVAAALRR